MNRKNLYEAMLLILFTPAVAYTDTSPPRLYPDVCVDNAQIPVPCENKKYPEGNGPISNRVYYLTENSGGWPSATDENGNVGQQGAYQGLAIGNSSTALLGSTVAGDTASSGGKYGVAIGASSNIDYESPNSVAVGAHSNVSGKYSVALGSHSTASTSGNYSVALGNSSVADGEYVVSIGDNKNNILRKLVNLKDGDISDDSKEAINGSQLKKVQDAIETNKKAIENYVNQLNLASQMAQEHSETIISLTERVGALEKKFNP